MWRLESAARIWFDICRLRRIRARHVIAAFCLTAACLLVRYIPLRKWRGWIENDDDTAVSPEQSETARRLGRCVEHVARYLPFRVVCLPQAIAARWMIERCGIPTVLTIGVRPASKPMASKRVDLHAWLIVGEACVVGATDRLSFAAFQQPPRS